MSFSGLNHDSCNITILEISRIQIDESNDQFCQKIYFMIIKWFAQSKGLCVNHFICSIVYESTF